MKNILLGGDSWGCGEWSISSDSCYISHRGLEQYLIEEGFNVINCSHGGASNIDSINAIELNLSLYNDNFFDFIIWFQSDPLRDYRPYHDKFPYYTNYDHLLQDQNRLLDISYSRLNHHNKKIICIGGCSKLTNDIYKYENLISFIPSVIELLIPNFIAPDVWVSDWHKILNQRAANINVLNQILNNKKIQDRLAKFDIFIPDSRHPNRHGHYIIYSKFKKEFIKGK